MSLDSYASIAVFRPIPSKFEYLVPPCLQDDLRVGSVCSVPFRGESARGVVVNLHEEASFSGDKREINGVISDRPLSSALMELAGWICHQTFTPLGQVFHRMVPADLSQRPREKKVIELTGSFEAVREFVEKKRNRAPKQAEILECLLTSDEPVEKNDLLEMARSSRSPLKGLKERGLLKETSIPEIKTNRKELPFEIDLPEPPSGVLENIEDLSATFTKFSFYASGRELLPFYLKIVRTFVESGTVLFLTPDVTRASWLSELFRRELGLRALAYHSDLTGGEQSYRWNTALTGGVDVFVGVLSAVYLPLPTLGGIVIDGEGDRNFELKEQDPKGNLVEIALKRGEIEGRPVIYAGEAPSIRSYFEMKTGSLTPLDREGRRSITPSTRGVEIRVASYDSSDNPLSLGFKRELRENYEQGEPALIVGERAGPSNAAICDNCGSILRCPDCEIPLAYSGSGRHGVCPYCGLKKEMLVCDNCGSEAVRFIGGGLKAVEDELKFVLPGGNFRRIGPKRGSNRDLSKLLRGLIEGELDVLLGTRSLLTPFLADRISLLGLLDLDIVLNRPTYRSTEFLFQRILRSVDILESGGKVFLHGLRSDQLPLGAIASGKWHELYENELESRRRMSYPPLRELIEISFRGTDVKSSEEAAEDLKDKLNQLGVKDGLLGPMKEGQVGGRKDSTGSKLMVKTDDLEGVLERIHSVVDKENKGNIRLNPYS